MVDEDTKTGTNVRFVGALAGIGSGLAKVCITYYATEVLHLLGNGAGYGRT